MTTEYVCLDEDITVEDALKRIRRTGVDKETINTCYVTDNNRKLIGIVTVRTLLLAEETDIICDGCGSKMIIKNGRFGKFAACPNYPKCKFTKQKNKEKNNQKEKQEDASTNKSDEEDISEK